MLWVKGNYFEAASFPVPHALHLDPASLMRLVSSSPQKDNPWAAIDMSWWTKAAEEALAIKPKLAQLLFELFDEAFREEAENVSDKINLIDFALFLFVMNSFKETDMLVDTPWVFDSAGGGASSPITGGSHPISPRASIALNSKTLDEGRQIKFIKSHIQAILSLLSGSTSSSTLTAERFDRLGLILGGGPNQCNQVANISTLVPSWQQDPGAKPTVAAIAEWVIANLVRNTVLNPPNLASPAARSNHHVEDTEMAVPGAVDTVPRLLILQNQHKATVVRCAYDLVTGCGWEGSQNDADAESATRNLRIVNCCDCFIYLLAPFKNVTVAGCVNCTIVLGAVARTTFVQSCEKLRLSVATRRLRINNCVDCTLYLWVKSPPLLIGENHGLVLAPHNIHYHHLSRLLHLASISCGATASNYWNQPNAVAQGDQDVLTGTMVPGHALMPPINFFPMSVPVEPPSNAADIPSACPPPPQYAAALEEKHKAVVVLREKIKALDCSGDESKRDLKAAIHHRFKEWLVSSGEMRQVNDLFRLDSARNPGTG